MLKIQNQLASSLNNFENKIKKMRPLNCPSPLCKEYLAMQHLINLIQVYRHATSGGDPPARNEKPLLNFILISGKASFHWILCLMYLVNFTWSLKLPAVLMVQKLNENWLNTNRTVLVSLILFSRITQQNYYATRYWAPSGWIYFFLFVDSIRCK